VLSSAFSSLQAALRAAEAKRLDDTENSDLLPLTVDLRLGELNQHARTQGFFRPKDHGQGYKTRKTARDLALNSAEKFKAAQRRPSLLKIA
jgi:hypothetical protein